MTKARWPSASGAKDLLLRNCWSDFEIISHDSSFGDPFQKLFTIKILIINKHGSGEWGLFALYRQKKKNLQNSSSLKCAPLPPKKLPMVLSKIQLSDPGPS